VGLKGLTSLVEHCDFIVVGTAVSVIDCVRQNIIPTNKPGAEPKRPGRPVNITRLCDLSASVVNNIIVTWNVEEDRVCAAFLTGVTACKWGW